MASNNLQRRNIDSKNDLMTLLLNVIPFGILFELLLHENNKKTISNT
jgi:hypothetical protein